MLNTLLVVTMVMILRVVGPHAKLVIIDNDDCDIFDDNDDEDNDWLVSRAANVKAAQVSCFAAPSCFWNLQL